VWSPEGRFLLGGVEADDQLIAIDAAAHVSAEHERQAAEHRPLGDVARSDSSARTRAASFWSYGIVYSRSVLGGPNAANTPVSGKPVSAATRSPRSVSTISP
jgi:hypothetical protein